MAVFRIALNGIVRRVGAPADSLISLRLQSVGTDARSNLTAVVVDSSPSGIHMKENWQLPSLAVGDVITIEVLPPGEYDPPDSDVITWSDSCAEVANLLRAQQVQFDRQSGLQRQGTPDTELGSCSFCGKNTADGVQIVAGPGVAICRECIALCAEHFEGE